MHPTIFSVNDLKALIENQVDESKWLDYKREIHLSSDRDKREFLKDVSAFANTEGGYLVYGIAEEEGKPIGVVGVEGSIDSIKLRMEQILETGLNPRLYGYTITSYLLEGKTVLVLHVTPSWNRPHMVLKDDYRFYERTNAGVARMDISGLREAFLGAASLIDRAESFRQRRAKAILQIPTLKQRETNEQQGILAWHFLPFQSFSPDFQVELNNEEVLKGFYRLEGVHSGRFNFEGYLRGRWRDETFLEEFWQIFRDGKIEYVSAHTMISTQGKEFLPLGRVDYLTATYCLPNLFLLRSLLRPSPPYFLGLSILNIRGIQPFISPPKTLSTPTPVLNHDHLFFPYHVVENWSKDSLLEAFCSLLEQFWQSFGISHDLYLDNITQAIERVFPEG